MELREVTYLAVALRIVIAMIVGGLIGLERGIKNRAAGLRTHMLVCVGACVIMLTNQYIFQMYGSGDPVRMGAQVVSGIGFLGAGTIIVTRRNQIKGLTTAAGLWSAAGVGLALGVGFYEAAVVGTVAVFAVIALMQRMDNNLHRRSRQLEAYFELSGTSLGDFLRTMRESGIEVSEVQRESGEEENHEVRAYVATLKGQKRQNHAELMAKVMEVPGVIFAEEL